VTGGAEGFPHSGRSTRTGDGARAGVGARAGGRDRSGGGTRAGGGSGARAGGGSGERGGGGAADPSAGVLPAPLHVHRAGETGLLAEYPDTVAVLAAAEAMRDLAPAHLLDLVPAERTLLLRGADPRDVPRLADLLAELPRTERDVSAGGEANVGIVYDGDDLDEVADLLGMSTDALISAHSGATWTVAFGGFAPGFPYLVAGDPHGTADGHEAAHGHGAADGHEAAHGHGAADGRGVTDGRRRSRPGRAPSGEEGTTADVTAAEGGSALGRSASVGPPWEVPRRAEPRTAVPAGAVGLASRYCGIYPRPSPGGWQLIGRSDALLFDVHREPPALLAPGTRVRFTPQRPSARPSAGTAAVLARAAREAAAVPSRLGRRGAAAHGADARPALEVLSPGPLTLVEDAGRPGRASIGVSSSGAFDQGALRRANRAVGNPGGAAALETLLGPLLLRAVAPTVVAVAGARTRVRIGRGEEEVGDVELLAEVSREQALALDPGDRIEVGPASDGLRLVLAVRGGISRIRRAAHSGGAGDAPRVDSGAARVDSGAVRADSGAPQDDGGATRDDGDAPRSDGDAPRADGAADSGVRRDPDGNELLEVLGARSRDTLSGLGPDPLRPGDLLLVGPEQGLEAVPAVVVPAGTRPGTARPAGDPAEDPVVEPAEESTESRAGEPAGDPAEEPAGEPVAGPPGDALGIPMLIGPRAELLGDEAVAALRRAVWTVCPDSDRVGVRLEGSALPVPEGAAAVPSEPMQPGAVQVPPSGQPVVFGPDHPTTGGYPVIAVVTRRGVDRLAQAGPGTVLRFVDADEG